MPWQVSVGSCEVDRYRRWSPVQAIEDALFYPGNEEVSRAKEDFDGFSIVPLGRKSV